MVSGLTARVSARAQHPVTLGTLPLLPRFSGFTFGEHAPVARRTKRGDGKADTVSISRKRPTRSGYLWEGSG